LLPVSDLLAPTRPVFEAPVATTGPAVVVEDLWIKFETTHENLGTTMRHVLLNLHRRSKTKRTVEALRGVSFSVPAGSVYGVIGKNGAGKSTLFRVLAGIMPPDAGRVTLYGRTTPLLSLGVGFNRELTGRENILLGGLGNGLQSNEIEAHAAEIEAFADLGEAIDYPMRTYSSGMFARLGFAVAAHLSPEILLIDEALSAGDAKFKDKCMAKIVELCAADCTVLIVTHGLEIVRQLASRCLWLEKGDVRMEGPANDVAGAYLAQEGVQEVASSFLDV
jgi:ABC-type polysaccharide/polyol phosphate transport system ATPase subunit